jgi:hypothetical protein
MSASGKSFNFKGIDYGGASYGVYVNLVEMPRMPRPRVAIDGYAQRSGAATQGATFDESRLVLQCGIKATSTANLETLLTNVVAALSASQYEGPGTLILNSHATKAWRDARLVSGLDGVLAYTGEQFQLEFLLADPWAAATTATELAGAISDTGTTTVII